MALQSRAKRAARLELGSCVGTMDLLRLHTGMVLPCLFPGRDIRRARRQDAVYGGTVEGREQRLSSAAAASMECLSVFFGDRGQAVAGYDGVFEAPLHVFEKEFVRTASTKKAMAHTEAEPSEV